MPAPRDASEDEDARAELMGVANLHIERARWVLAEVAHGRGAEPLPGGGATFAEALHDICQALAEVPAFDRWREAYDAGLTVETRERLRRLYRDAKATYNREKRRGPGTEPERRDRASELARELFRAGIVELAVSTDAERLALSNLERVLWDRGGNRIGTPAQRRRGRRTGKVMFMTPGDAAEDAMRLIVSVHGVRLDGVDPLRAARRRLPPATKT